MLLKPEQRQKLDQSEDTLFYSVPRFVTHVDDNFIIQLTKLYQKKLNPNTRILDLMSSWVSHLPPEMVFSHIEGHGMNKAELQRNPRLSSYFVQDLNQNPQLPLKDQDFDAVLCAVSIQYLQYPEAIFSEIYRILKAQGIAIFSFSNRMFYQKAIAVWRDATEAQRIYLVKSYFQSVPGFSKPETFVIKPDFPSFWQMLGFAGADPFYVVYSYKT
jgi:SAM-dependent methyltransferase